jgi:hypothetical protein
MKISSNTLFFAHPHEVIKRLDSCQFNLIYIDPPYYRGVKDDELPYKTFRQYLEYIVFVIHNSKRLLTENGSILFRMDPLSPFNSRLFLDRIFGKQNLRAEVIWEFVRRRGSSRLPRANFDTVYLYSKSDTFTYHEPVLELSEQELKQEYRHKDNKGYYKYWSLIAPIDRPNMQFRWKGMKPAKGSSWKYSLQSLEKMYNNGEIEIGERPKRKVYLTEDSKNSPMGFVWKGFVPLRPEDNKTDSKIQEIAKMASKPYEFIFDPFMLPRLITSIEAIDRKWAGVALLKDHNLYRFSKGVINTKTSEEISGLEITDTGKLTKSIISLIDAESKALDDSSSFIYDGQRYAVLIGINNYKDGIPNLKYCINDVNALEKVLTKSGYIVKTMHDEQEDDDLLPLRANILAEVEKMASSTNSEDTIFVHLSCHGTIVDNHATFITSDTRRKQLSKTCLYLDDVVLAMKCGAAKKLVLSLDVCHAGIDISRDIIEQEFVDNVYNNAEGLALLAASSARQTAAEPSELEHGLFTYFLIEGLNGEADFDGDGLITVTDINDFTLNEIRAWNLKNLSRQDPTYRFEGIGEILLISPVPVTS